MVGSRPLLYLVLFVRNSEIKEDFLFFICNVHINGRNMLLLLALRQKNVLIY